MKHHDLKIWPQYFAAVREGVKRFEIRRDDRGFAVGDVLRLREWDPDSSQYSGFEIRVRVTYLTPPECPGIFDGWVILGIERLK